MECVDCVSVTLEVVVTEGQVLVVVILLLPFRYSIMGVPVTVMTLTVGALVKACETVPVAMEEFDAVAFGVDSVAFERKVGVTMIDDTYQQPEHESKVVVMVAREGESVYSKKVNTHIVDVVGMLVPFTEASATSSLTDSGGGNLKLSRWFLRKTP